MQPSAFMPKRIRLPNPNPVSPEASLSPSRHVGVHGGWIRQSAPTSLAASLSPPHCFGVHRGRIRRSAPTSVAASLSPPYCVGVHGGRWFHRDQRGQCMVIVSSSCRGTPACLSSSHINAIPSRPSMRPRRAQHRRRRRRPPRRYKSDRAAI